MKSDADSIMSGGEITPLVYQLASTNILERTPFVIDEAGDEDEDDLEEGVDELDGGGGGHDIMDEVSLSGLSQPYAY